MTTMHPHEHSSRVASIVTQIKSCGKSKIAMSTKGRVGHCVRTNSWKKNCWLIDVSKLNHFLSINVSNQSCTVEPGITFEQLCLRLLPLGYLPLVVPEFKNITVGGAIQGLGVESSSFKHGLFEDSINAVDVVVGEGTLIHASKSNASDLFHAMFGSYGTMGVLVKVNLQLMPATTQVRITYRPMFGDQVLKKMAAGNWFTSFSKDDFCEAIVYAKDHGVVITAKFVEEHHENQHSFLPGQPQPMFGKTIPTYSTFSLQHTWPRCIVYHLIYHNSIQLHANHLFLLHVYQLGLLTLVACLPSICLGTLYTAYYCVPLYVASLALCMFEILFARGTVYGWTHSMLVVLPLTAAAQYISEIMVEQWNYIAILICLGVIVVSLLLQVLGHVLYEEFQAPPANSHGFLAAPVLEWTCLWLRVFPDTNIWTLVKRARDSHTTTDERESETGKNSKNGKNNWSSANSTSRTSSGGGTSTACNGLSCWMKDPSHWRFWWGRWFYQHAAGAGFVDTTTTTTTPTTTQWDEVVPTMDYLFRHDRGIFWCAEVRGISTSLCNRLTTGWYWSSSNAYKAEHQSNVNNDFHRIVQDIAIPVSKLRLERFIKMVDTTLKVYPLWLCPIRNMGSASAAAAANKKIFSLPTNQNEEEWYVNVGIYGAPMSWDGRPFHLAYVTAHRALEDTTRRLNGRKGLYSTSYYTETEWSQEYDMENYNRIRRKYKLDTCVVDIFTKCVQKLY